MRPPRPSRRLPAVLALGLALAAFPLGTLASHDFADVPDSNIFHADISALAASGVTTGCGGGNFCPSAFVTREQMAAFMNRLGALAPEKTPVVNAAELSGLTADQFARTDQTQHYSCAGTDMAPTNSASVYPSGLGFRSLTSGDDNLSCAVHLPDGATITGFSADVYDGTGSYETTCVITRLSAPGGTDIAITNSSGATPGATTLVDATIDSAVVDNAAYAYTARCLLDGGAGGDLGVYKVTVTYTGAP